MFQTGKLKPNRSIGGLIVPLAALLLFGMSAFLFGAPTGFFVMAGVFGIFALYSLLVIVRTGNLGWLVICAYQVFAAVMLFFAAQYLAGTHQVREEWKIAWVTGFIFFSVLIIYLGATKRIKWRGREILELAAAPVEETGNGYTPRPRPVGRVEFSKQEILAFARFCARHLIAVVYVSPRQATFVPVRMGSEDRFLLRVGGADLDSTWISFDFDGDVSVHIAQKDHLDFIEPLSFDKLCESLGRLFIEFAEMHRRGEGVRIIDRLDALRMSYFS